MTPGIFLHSYGVANLNEMMVNDQGVCFVWSYRYMYSVVR